MRAHKHAMIQKNEIRDLSVLNERLSANLVCCARITLKISYLEACNDELLMKKSMVSVRDVIEKYERQAVPSEGHDRKKSQG